MLHDPQNVVDKELVKDLFKQLKKSNKESIKKDKKIQMLVNVIRENELNMQELEAANEELKLEVQYVKDKLATSENHVNEIFSKIKKEKETVEICQMSEVTKRKLKRQCVH